MYSLEEIKSWWEVPAIAHFFSLFKSCFSLTDFTIEELEESLLTDGEDDKSTIFTSRLLTELLQGCYDNPNISVTTYHDTLIHIMKTRWEEEDGRVNPLSSINADFHSLPTQLKVQIIHRLTEYRLDAYDVDCKLAGLNPSDLRLEPLGVDRNGSKYWYFFGVRLYKETTPKKKPKKRKRENKIKKKKTKKPKLHSGTINKSFLKLVNGESKEKPSIFDDAEYNLCGINNFSEEKKFKKKSKKHKKDKQDDNEKIKSTLGLRYGGLTESRWEIVCYNVNDWKKLAMNLGGGNYEEETALCLLITDNFLPNLPKIVEDMEIQRLQKEQMELNPRRSSCRLLAKKLYEAEDGEMSFKHTETLKRERREREVMQSKEREERMTKDFEKMVQNELERMNKVKYERWKKEWEEHKRKRLSLGLPVESDSSSDENFAIDDSHLQYRLQPPLVPKSENKKEANDKKLAKTSSRDQNVSVKVEPTAIRKRGRPPSSAAAKNAKLKESSKKPALKGRRKSKDTKKKQNLSSDEERDEWEDDLLHQVANDHEYVAMKEAWETLDSHEDAWPFQTPVEEWYAPGYHNIIKRPMDLSTIEVKLNERKYQMVLEFKDDITLMFNNCRLYNGPDNEYTKVANVLDKLFQKTLFIGLTRKRTDDGNRKSTNDNNEKQSIDEGTTNSVDQEQSRFPEDVLDEIEEDEESVEESSDEFTPPGVPKKKRRKSKTSTGSVRGVGRGRGRGKAVGRGRGRRPSVITKSMQRSPDIGKASPAKSDSDISLSDQSEVIEKVKERSKSSRGRGRGAKSRRGRKPSVNTKMKQSNAKDSSSESSDEDKHYPRNTSNMRARGRGGSGRGRGRNKRLVSVSKRAKSSDTNTSESEVSDNDIEKEKTDHSKKPVSPGGTDNNSDIDISLTTSSKTQNTDLDTSQSLDLPTQFDKSSARDAETSSSSSRASSRSHSPGKAEKPEDEVKSKPLEWSLSYLASQAQVLEEQNKKKEALSSKPSLSMNKKQSTYSNNTTENKRVFNETFKQKIPDSPLSQLSNKSSIKEMSSGEAIYAEAAKNSSSFNDQQRTSSEKSFNSHRYKSRLPGGSTTDERDIYNFCEDDSPRGLFSKSSNEQIIKSHLSHKPNPAKPNNNLSSSDMSSKESHVSSTHSQLSQLGHSGETAPESKTGGLKCRHRSPEQLSSPLTPSSGYESVKTTSSNISQLSASPHSASDNNTSSTSGRLNDNASNKNTVDSTDSSVEKSSPRPALRDEESRKYHSSMTFPQANPNQPPTENNSTRTVSEGKNDLSSSNFSSHNRVPASPALPSQPSFQKLPLNQQSPRSLEQNTPHISHSTSVANNKNSTSYAQAGIHQPLKQAVSNPVTQMLSKPSQVISNRRSSQSMVMNQSSVKSPGYQHTTTAMLNNRAGNNDNSHNNQKRLDKPPGTVRQHSTTATTTGSSQPPQNTRFPSYNTQPHSTSHISSDRMQSSEKSVPLGMEASSNQPPNSRVFDQRPSNRGVDTYRNNPVSSSHTIPPQSPYNYNSPASAAGSKRNAAPAGSSGHEKPPNYHQRGNDAGSSLNVINQNPTMASFGLTPQSLSQPPHDENRSAADAAQPVQRKASIPPGGYQTSKPASIPQQRQNIQPQRQSQSSHHYHTAPASNTHPPPAPVKHRNPSSNSSTVDSTSSGSNIHPSKHHQRHSNSSSSSQSGISHSGSVPTCSGHPGSGQGVSGHTGSSQPVVNRRQSANNTLQYQQKATTDYMGYHIPSTPGPTPRDGLAPPYSSHQQNGLLSGSGSVSNMHQDLTASATLRALQQHKTDRSTHAAASMYYAAAAAAQHSQGAAAAAANEQYNRLAATAHHRATSQHPLAGVYHPHHQNPVTSGTHQAAAHLSSPWLQAAAAGPAAGYPSNLIPHPHMDPVYHLMQQSGMHGQYPMYPNHVMQQLHQQHLQHHMLPKY